LAIAELDTLLASPALTLTTLLPTGSLLLLDNSRWFHARTAVLDSHRHLKRIRFNACDEKRHTLTLAPRLLRLVSRTDSLQQQQEEQEEEEEEEAKEQGYEQEKQTNEGHNKRQKKEDSNLFSELDSSGSSSSSSNQVDQVDAFIC
jgi:uncharacterized protein with von Willebrand factor type A (vWA) domain